MAADYFIAGWISRVLRSDLMMRDVIEARSRLIAIDGNNLNDLPAFVLINVRCSAVSLATVPDTAARTQVSHCKDGRQLGTRRRFRLKWLEGGRHCDNQFPVFEERACF
jgi:hypothetical protein